MLSSEAVVRVRECVFERNQSDDGGAICLTGPGQAEISASTFVGNSAYGSALYAEWGANALVTNSTFSDNDRNSIALSFGGGAELRHVTVYASGSYGLSATFSSHARLSHTVIAGSGSSACSFVFPESTITTLGYNLEDGDTCNLDPLLGDLVGEEPALGVLQANGGPTMTRAPLFGSPLVDAGAAMCWVAVDQRGVPRPLDGDGDGTARCDIGSVELQPPLFCDGFESGNTSAWSATVPAAAR
jgi:hypothetical protein